MSMREPSTGELDRRLTLRLTADYAVSDFDIKAEKSPEAKVWAQIVAVGTATYSAGVQEENKITHRITIRYRAPLTESHELVDGTQVYRVKRCAPLGSARRFLLVEVELVTT